MVVLPSGSTIEYVIDGQNRRIGRKVNGVLVQAWLYQNHLHPVAELDGSGNVVSRFVYGTRGNVPDYMVKNGVAYRLITDHLGSVRLAVDTATGVVAQRIDYDGWGMVTQNTSPGFQPFGFAGGLYEGQTGLVRFGARDYDPLVGRWTTKDPIRFQGGDPNLFAYALGDPVNTIDENGQIVPILALAALVAGGAIIGGVVNSFIQGVTFLGCGEGFLAGAKRGFVSGAVGGALGVLPGLIGGPVLGGAVGSAAITIISAPEDDLTPGDVVTSSVAGAATAGLVKVAGIGASGNELEDRLLRSAYGSAVGSVPKDVSQRLRRRSSGCECK